MSQNQTSKIQFPGEDQRHLLAMSSGGGQDRGENSPEGPDWNAQPQNDQSADMINQVYGTDEAYEIIHIDENSSYKYLSNAANEESRNKAQIQKDRLSNRIIENILNEEKATTSVKKMHFRAPPIVQVNRYNLPDHQQAPSQNTQPQQQQANPKTGSGPQYLSPAQNINPYLSQQHQSNNNPPANTLKTQSVSQNHEADQSLSQSFLTAQIQQSQGTQQQTPGNHSFQTSGQNHEKDKDSNNPYQNSFKYTVKGSDNYPFLPNPSNQIVLIDEMSSQPENQVEMQQSESDINRGGQSEFNKLQNQSLGFSSDHDNAFKKSVNKVDKSLQNLNPMQIEELLVPQQQNRSSAEPDIKKIADQFDINQLPDDSTVVIDNLQGSSYLDVSYKLPPGLHLMESVEILKDSQHNTLQQSTIKRDFNTVQKNDFNTTIKMAWKKDNQTHLSVLGGATGHTPLSKSPQMPMNHHHPQIEWLNKVQSAMKRDIEQNKKNKLKTIHYSGKKDQQPFDQKSRCSNSRIADGSSLLTSNEKYSRQLKSSCAQSGTSTIKQSNMMFSGEPSLSKSKAQKRIEAIRHSRSVSNYVSQYDAQNQGSNVIINLEQDRQQVDKKNSTQIHLQDLLQQCNSKPSHSAQKSFSRDVEQSRIEKTAAKTTFDAGEECDLDEAELDDEEQDAVKWKLDQDWDIKSGLMIGQQTMIMNNNSKAGIDIGLDLRNMTSMGQCNLNETALLQDLSEVAPAPPVNKQSVFYRRKHKKNFSMHVVGNMSNTLFNQTALISQNDSQGGHHQRTGSANGISDNQINLNQTTQIALTAITPIEATKIQSRTGAISPCSTVKQQCVTPNLNFCQMAEMFSHLPSSCNQSMLSRVNPHKNAAKVQKQPPAADSKSAAASRKQHVSPQATCNKLYAMGKSKQLKKKENQYQHLNSIGHKRLNSLEPPNARDLNKKSNNKQQQVQQTNTTGAGKNNQRLRSAGRNNNKTLHVNTGNSSAFTVKNSIKSEKKKASQFAAGQSKKQKGLTPHDFSHKYEELMQKKMKTEEKVARLAKEKKDKEERYMNAQINQALARKVTKSRELEALARFNNYGQNHKAKLEQLKQQKEKEEEDMLKKLFKPKIIKNYKTAANRSREATLNRNKAKSVNTYNYFSRNDCMSYVNDGLSIEFAKQINEDNTVESNLNYLTNPLKPFKLKQAQSFNDEDTQKNSEQNNNINNLHNQSRTFDLRCNMQSSSIGQKSQQNSKQHLQHQQQNLGLSCQQSIHSNLLDALDMDSEAFDRLESFYGKFGRKSSLPCHFQNTSQKKSSQAGAANNANPFSLKKGLHPVPRLDLDNLKTCQPSQSGVQHKQHLSHSPKPPMANEHHSHSLIQPSHSQKNSHLQQQQTTIHLISAQEESQQIANKFDEQYKVQQMEAANNDIALHQLDSQDWLPSDQVQDLEEGQELLEDGLTESEAEFLVEDIDEHASQRVSPLKNDGLKMKFNQKDQFVANVVKQNDNAIEKQQAIPKAQSKMLYTMHKPPFSRKNSKPKQQVCDTTVVFNKRTKNSVFKGSKGSLAGKDLSLVGKKVKKMEQQQGDTENLSKYEMSLTEIQASSASMRMAKSKA